MTLKAEEKRRFDFVLAGNIIVDVVKTIDVYPNKLQLARIEKVELAMGGLVCNCAASLSRLDPTLSICAVGVIGDDESGDFIRLNMERETGVCLDYIQKRGVTSTTDVMTIAATGERTFFSYSGSGNTLDLQDVPLDELSGGVFHAGYAMLLECLDMPDQVYGTRMARLLHDARERGFLTSLDVVSDHRPNYEEAVAPSLRYTDILAINDLEAERITGVTLRQNGHLLRKNLQRACRALKEMGVQRWTVIHMPEMSCGEDEHGCFIEAPCLMLPKGYIQGSVGAGDAFTSALLLSAFRGYALADALYAANAVAAHSLSKPGAAEAVVPIPQAVRLYDLFPVMDLESEIFVDGQEKYT